MHQKSPRLSHLELQFQNKKPKAILLQANGFPYSLDWNLHTKMMTSKQLLRLPEPSAFSVITFSGQALDLLVTVSSIHYCTSTSVLST